MKKCVLMRKVHLTTRVYGVILINFVLCIAQILDQLSGTALLPMTEMNKCFSQFKHHESGISAVFAISMSI